MNNIRKKKFGVEALEQLPDTKKPRRAFTFSNTLGRDKELLRKMIEEYFEDFSPKEVPIPKNIKNVGAFLHRWELDIFYEEIIRFIIDEEITDDAPIYVGDIDTVIFWEGHFLFIEEKTQMKS